MADQWIIHFENKKNGVKGTCTKEEWYEYRKSPLFRQTVRLVKREQVFEPQAAVEAKMAAMKASGEEE